MLQTKGIVIRALKYGETSVIADVFTEEKGLCSFIGGNVRSARSRMPFSLFQAMSPVVLVSYWKEDASALQRLRECRADWVLTGIPFDLSKGAVALFMAEVLRKCLQHGEEQSALFDYLSETVAYLDQTRQPVAHIPLHFLVHLTLFLGFQPQMGASVAAQYFDLKEGATSPHAPAHGWWMSPAQTRQLAALSDLSIEQCHELKWSAEERKSLLQKMIQYYQLHIAGFGEIHTPEVLEMVFRG